MGLKDDLKNLAAQGVMQSEDGDKKKKDAPKSLMDELSSMSEKKIAHSTEPEGMIGKIAENTATDLGSFMNAATLGLTGGLDKLGHGIYGAIAGDGFSEGVNQYNQNMQARRERAGAPSTAGDIAGSVLGMLGGAGLVSKGAKAGGGMADDFLNWVMSSGDNVAQGAGKAASRIAGAGATGATTEASIRSGAGSDSPGTDAALGGLGAAVGQGVIGEALVPMGKWAMGTKVAGSKAAQERGRAIAGDYLTGQSRPGDTSKMAAIYDMPQQTADDWARTAQGLKQGQIMGDTSDEAAQALRNTIMDPATVGTTGQLKDLSASRINNAARDVSDIVSDAMAPVYSKYGGKLQYEQARAAAGEQYAALFDKGAGSLGTGISRKTIMRGLPQFFGKDSSKALAKVGEDIASDLSNYLGAGRKGNTDEMTRKGMQNLLSRVDDLIRTAKPNDANSSGNAQAYVALVKLRNNIKGKMNAAIPGYKEAANAYADAAALRSAGELGETAYRSSKISAEELATLADEMGDAERIALVDGFVNTARSGVGGDVSTARNIMRGDDLRREKLGVLIGPDKLDDFLTKLDTQAKELTNAKQWEGALASRNAMAEMADEGASASVGVVGSTHWPYARPRVSAARSGHSGAADTAAAQQEIAQYLMQNNPSDAASIMNILDQAAQNSKKRPLSRGAIAGALGPTILD